MTWFQKLMIVGFSAATLLAQTSQAGVFDGMFAGRCPNLRNDTCYVIKMSDTRFVALIPMGFGGDPKKLVRWDNRSQAAAIEIAKYQFSIGTCVEIYNEIVEAQNCH